MPVEQSPPTSVPNTPPVPEPEPEEEEEQEKYEEEPGHPDVLDEEEENE